ncbi:MAG TPA: ABC-2 transporter permease [Acidobacteriaceae bacterium]|nr:ABC-2 transporter permease [Acidobacteriaceae bacterium]
MRGSVVGALILKDLRMWREAIVLSILGGVIALAVVQLANEVSVVVGSVCFFIALILVGTMIPLAGIVNERKNKNLAFVMSLPVSSIQYTTSKLLSSTGIYLIPWMALVAAGLLIIQVRGFPHGLIPLALILELLPFIGFAIITAAALMGESEGWGILANVVVQCSYGLTWFFISRVPEVMKYNNSPVIVWSPTDLRILGTEVAIIPLLLVLTYFVLSRKRDFI